jgi:hypothetical protein
MAITALNPKPLASGQLPNAKGTLGTVPALTTWMFTGLMLANTDTADRVCNIYLKTAAGTSKHIVNGVTIPAGSSLPVKIGGQMLDAGGLIEGDADVAAKVDYYGSVVEIT